MNARRPVEADSPGRSGGSRALSEADARYLAGITEDCEQILGAGIIVLGVGLGARDGQDELTVSYRPGAPDEAEPWVTTARGDTILAAHIALREQLVVDRLRLGFSALIGPT